MDLVAPAVGVNTRRSSGPLGPASATAAEEDEEELEGVEEEVDAACFGEPGE
jgi:hypothetical protein